VTVLAVRAFLSFMFVVFPMAGITLHRSALVPIPRMTAFADYLRVFAPQGILCLIVIEMNILPRVLRMTVLT
jgi:hypothetical protein